MIWAALRRASYSGQKKELPGTAGAGEPTMAYSEIFMQQSLQLIGSIAEILMARNLMMGTAESCTGGLVAALCTEVPGSSSWFAGGVVSYSNALKESLLGVEGCLIERYGAVSGPVAEHMACGAIKNLNVQAALAISGIAGPDGGSADKPVGTVWIGAAVSLAGMSPVANTRSFSRHFVFPGSRQEVRASAVLHSLELLLDILKR